MNAPTEPKWNVSIKRKWKHKENGGEKTAKNRKEWGKRAENVQANFSRGKKPTEHLKFSKSDQLCCEKKVTHFSAQMRKFYDQDKIKLTENRQIFRNHKQSGSWIGQRNFLNVWENWRNTRKTIGSWLSHEKQMPFEWMVTRPSNCSKQMRNIFSTNGILLLLFFFEILILKEFIIDLMQGKFEGY